eukprot:TRINITY_DN38605_c0_g1_i2.p1 TRINITY_DN38605_c0_g1~~TRINITY_DN38605_c0_g1_i2.p1  ORF type:complete len:337 (+),score=74.96 TRINITY_DN38605_c0_g1_i2:180-1190(+)
MAESKSSDKDSRSSDSAFSLVSGVLRATDMAVDYWWWNDYIDAVSGRYIDEDRDGRRMGLMTAIFSYVFGDGNANRDWRQRQLKAALGIIQAKNGVICAEDVAGIFAPDRAPPSAEEVQVATVPREDWILPLLVALDGSPQVTDSGDIVYVFPQVIRRLAQGSGVPTRARKGTWLQKRPQPFSKAQSGKLTTAAVLGAVDLLLALKLGSLLTSVGSGYARGSSVAGIVAVYPFLLAYGILFNAVPAVRYFRNWRQNKRIGKENEMREAWAAFAEQGVPARKLLAAQQLAKAEAQQAAALRAGDRVTYSTDSSASKAAAEKDRQTFEDFDKKLRRLD